MVGWLLLNTVLIVSCIIKLLIMLQAFEMFGILMNLLVQVSRDMMYFIVFFVTSVLVFSWLFQICGIEIYELGKEDDNDFKHVQLQFQYFLFNFKNSVGDFDIPKYAKWTE